jgi:acetyl esterase/lipase
MPAKKNISYIKPGSAEYHSKKHLLDVYIPSFTEVDPLFPVLVFIHGGTWMSGSKELYSLLGTHFAAKGVVTVIINYRLGNLVTVDKMAEDCAAAVAWTYANIQNYRGDPNRIYLSGHSAGGHLAALVTLDADYHTLRPASAIKGCILIDAFGLNIGRFIREYGTAYVHYIEQIFTRHEKTWDKLSPVRFLSAAACPFLVFTGSHSYPFLLQDNALFVEQLKQEGISYSYESIPGKSHSQMITQMEKPDNLLYHRILEFMAAVQV